MKKIAIIITALLVLVSCGMTKTVTRVENKTIALSLTELPASGRYIDMDYGVSINVLDKRADKSVLHKYDAGALISKPQISTYPEIPSFVKESLKKYMQTMGFDIDADINTDYLLEVDITEYHISYLSGMGWMGTVYLEILLYDNSRKQVYPRTTVVGRSSINTSYTDYSSAEKAINTAYVNALKEIDWNRIVYFLKRADSASGEKNKQVTGKGDTALEHTIIRWFVDSSPKGADVYWRVVSSTPDVKNTNATFIGSSPYESTESFDIKGLTFNNSGDVQIEISCEKPGYITQKRRFNLRQVIEQKEISTKFNLVKEE